MTEIFELTSIKYVYKFGKIMYVYILWIYQSAKMVYHSMGAQFWLNNFQYKNFWMFYSIFSLELDFKQL